MRPGTNERDTEAGLLISSDGWRLLEPDRRLHRTGGPRLPACDPDRALAGVRGGRHPLRRGAGLAGGLRSDGPTPIAVHLPLHRSRPHLDADLAVRWPPCRPRQQVQTMAHVALSPTFADDQTMLLADSRRGRRRASSRISAVVQRSIRRRRHLERAADRRADQGLRPARDLAGARLDGRRGCPKHLVRSRRDLAAVDRARRLGAHRGSAVPVVSGGRHAVPRAQPWGRHAAGERRALGFGAHRLRRRAGRATGARPRRRSLDLGLAGLPDRDRTPGHVHGTPLERRWRAVAVALAERRGHALPVPARHPGQSSGTAIW